ncbi:MAG: hypothetical protein AAFN77_23085 [Planctomycetota bacterium]
MTRSMTGQPRRKTTVSYQSLEPRLALTTFIVNTTIDDISGTEDGLLSFREALIAANTNAPFGDAPAGDANGDAIRFDASIANSTISTINGEYTITDDLLIQGGSANITFSGRDADRIFNDTTSERVALSRLTFTEGNAPTGAAITSSGSGVFLITNASFDNNAASGTGGGAIQHADGNLYVVDSDFSQNAATGSSGIGGAILSAGGTTVIRGSEFTSNVANAGGGAIAISDGTLLAFDSQVGTSTFGNVAGPAASANPGNGGGVYVSSASSTVVIDNTQVVGNTAASEGGGLWNMAGSDLIVRNNSVISSNAANGNSSDEGGGGIFNNGGRVFLTSSTVTNNDATGTSGSGGGIFSTAGVINANATDVSANSAGRAGGGIEIVDGTLYVTNSTISGNDVGVDFAATPGNGGGIHSTGTATLVFQTGTEINNNVAAAEGGGLWVSATSTALIRGDSEVRLNVASGDQADQGGGGIFNNGGGVYVVGSLINSNQADGASGSGGGILSVDGNVVLNSTILSANLAVRAGGGVELIDGFFSMTNSTMSTNNAGVALAAAPGNGGGLHVTGTANSVFDNTLVAGNVAANQGGAIWNQVGSNVFLRNNTRVNLNTANETTTSIGGAIYNRGYLQALDSSFADNAAGGDGGGVFNTDTSRYRNERTSFNLNTAVANGGGIFNAGLLNVIDSAFTSNSAADGGAIFTETGGSTFTSGVTYSGNLPNNQN